MDDKNIIISVGLAILLPVIALVGIFGGKIQNQQPGILSLASSLEGGVNNVVSTTPIQQSPKTTTAQPVPSQAAPKNQTATPATTQDKKAVTNNGNNTTNSTTVATTQPSAQSTTPTQQPTPQKPISQDWKNFLSQYNSAPANLPNSSSLTSSSSLFVNGVQSPELFPIRNWQVPLEDIDGKAVLAVELPDNKILYEKNSLTALPIASISKLINSLVVIDSMALDEQVIVSKNAIGTTGTEGNLAVNESLSVDQLLHAMLLESSNDAAVALQEQYDKDNTGKGITFVNTMNQKAHELGLSSAFFEDSSGLSQNNVASAADVATLLFESYKNEIIRNILSLPTYDTVSKDGISHHWVSTNSLLGAIPGVVAGKTGYTDEAGECITVVTKVTNDKLVVTVVLGSTNRIQSMTSLITWVKDAYYWQ